MMPYNLKDRAREAIYDAERVYDICQDAFADWVRQAPETSEGKALLRKLLRGADRTLRRMKASLDAAHAHYAESRYACAAEPANAAANLVPGMREALTEDTVEGGA